MDWNGNIMFQAPYEHRGVDGELWPLQGPAGEMWRLQEPGWEQWQLQEPGGERWLPQDRGGEQWLPQESVREQWLPQERGGEQWLPQEPVGERWLPQEPVGERWLPQEPGGERWLPQEPGGERWLPQEPGGELWLPQEPGGELWLPQGPGGERWLLQGPGGERWPPQGPGGEARQPQGWPEDYGGAPEGHQEALGRRNYPPQPNDTHVRGQAQDFKNVIITADVNLPRLAVVSPTPYPNKPKRNGYGLPNLGNSSYMNAVLQCLYHTWDLTEFFCRGISWDDINEGSTTRGEVALAYSEVVKALESGKGKEETLRNLQRVCGDYDERFQGHDQKEAHDLLASLLQWLHQDLATGDLTCACVKKSSRKKQQQVKWKTEEPLNGRAPLRQGSHRTSENPPLRHPRTSGTKNIPPGAPWDSDETTEAQEPKARSCRACGVQKDNGSIISDLFVGIHESTIICLTSGTILCRTHERFTSLRLTLNVMGETELEDALQHYYRSQEILRPCVYCGREHVCRQETRILSLPRVLILHLIRYNPEHQGQRVSRVSFPDEGLGLDAYLATDLIPRGRRFSLTSVCNHHGSTTRGHYTACCRSRRQNRLLPQSWYLFDDSHVEPARNFRSPYEAYLLFYECLND
ncbi:ubiquitin carboxyl-terminal hydrolase 2-like [Panulirus ornatus]|uniref:ubiquitin carboxyl-terminal hydrolase 2-like n=1 Tax=Panulirus ornatus TaxID=150431 RepID=UPI003A87C1B1